MPDSVKPRIGVLVPAGNPTVEPEFYRMAPPSVTVHFARLDAGEGTPGAIAGLEQRLLVYADAVPSAVPLLAAVQPAVIVMAHTSVSYATGFANEPALADRIAALGGCPAVMASRAILAAFAHLGVRRIALATPYSEAVEKLGARYWADAGLDVVAHRRRLSVKPGLTCLWQVSGRNEVKDFRDWVRLDLEYIDNWSLWLDLKILWRTIPVVFIGTGAR